MKKITRMTLMLPVLFVSMSLSQAVFAQNNYGIYTSDPTAGIYTSDPTGGIYTSDPTAGIYTSDPTRGIYTSDPTGGIYTSDPTGGVYTSNPTGGIYTSPTSPSYSYQPSYSYEPSYNYTPSYSYTTGASYTTSPVGYTTGATTYSVPNFSSYPTIYGGSVQYVAPPYTTTYPTTNTTICSNGSAPINGSCARTTTLPTTNTTICSDGTTPINGSCARTNTIPVVTNTLCSDGTAPINGSCTRTNTIPVNNNTICSDGRLPVNGSCTYTNVIPTVYFQSCWDGSRIPTTSVCFAQYKTCSNGMSIPVNQTCYVTTPFYIPPQVVKFNNVVTSVATEISKTSGRCNGIGLIASNAPSTGWFEYGETSGLGRTTAPANIGSANTSPFSNVLTNLKPSTRYYCRAVMQNQYGLVKGEIVGFTTKATVVTYIKPVVKKPVVKPTTKPTNVITCVDGTTISTKSTSSATLLNQGQKLLAVQVEKIEGELRSGDVVRYKITYKNLADTSLTGVVVKVTLPQEIMFAGASAGTYDPMSRTLTFNQNIIDPYTEGVIVITGNVQKDAPIGKTLVTNVYAMYTVPGTNTQDEVTAYVVGSIMPATTISLEDTGAKKVVGASNVGSFMPNSLIEWLALLAILFIIFILGRSVYASYKDDEAHKH